MKCKLKGMFSKNIFLKCGPLVVFDTPSPDLLPFLSAQKVYNCGHNSVLWVPYKELIQILTMNGRGHRHTIHKNLTILRTLPLSYKLSWNKLMYALFFLFCQNVPFCGCHDLLQWYSKSPILLIYFKVYIYRGIYCVFR